MELNSLWPDRDFIRAGHFVSSLVAENVINLFFFDREIPIRIVPW